MLLTYYEDNQEGLQSSEITPITNTRFEDKYLEKFKHFPNNYVFTELELDQQSRIYEQLKSNHEKIKDNRLKGLREELTMINEIWQKVGDGVKFESTFENKKILLQFSCIQGDYEYYDEDGNEVTCYSQEAMISVDFDKLYQTIIDKKTHLEKEMREVSESVFSEEELRLEATQIVIDKKLDGYINNYVLEHTPLGNIYMRYNNDKKSFEYFSNNTIPYRYLETVGKKYVMTYWCKPLFVDTEEELKHAEIKYDEEQTKKKDVVVNKDIKTVFAKLKDYNKQTKGETVSNRPMKNRDLPNPLMSQITSNMTVNVNHPSGKILVKERSNRYTWEGRLTGFSPLQTIAHKKLHGNVTLSYAEFKKMQQEKENKKSL